MTQWLSISHDNYVWWKDLTKATESQPRIQPSVISTHLIRFEINALQHRMFLEAEQTSYFIPGQIYILQIHQSLQISYSCQLIVFLQYGR